mmetsp:Transcript_15275/g.41031  ORF Transcript_15275/g.41031 Transcript_15275/m.41031 type:complete len:98 (+) Transcript_15275:42-335(+)
MSADPNAATAASLQPEADLSAEYAAEAERHTKLRAELTRIEHLERFEVPDEPPDDVLPLPKPGDPKYSQEVYVNQSGVDSFITGISKRTPSGGFFTT